MKWFSKVKLVFCLLLGISPLKLQQQQKMGKTSFFRIFLHIFVLRLCLDFVCVSVTFYYRYCWKFVCCSDFALFDRFVANFTWVLFVVVAIPFLFQFNFVVKCKEKKISLLLRIIFQCQFLFIQQFFRLAFVSRRR